MTKDNDKSSGARRVYEVPVDGETFVFSVERAHFSRFLRERERDPDGAASNLLLNTVERGQREKLSALFDGDWVLSSEIAGKVLEDLIPARNLTVKKR